MRSNAVSAPVYGGSLFAATVENLVLDGNRFDENQATASGSGHGGALYIDISRTGGTEDVRLTGNQFTHNIAASVGSGEGGAAGITAIHLLVEDNAFTDNRVCTICDQPQGGALVIRGALESTGVSAGDVSVTRNWFEGNSTFSGVQGNGSALSILSTQGYTVTNNVFVANYGAEAVSLIMGFPVDDDAQGRLVNNTFFANEQGAALIDYWNETTAQVINNVVVSSSVGITVGAEGRAVLGYNLFNGNGVNVSGPGTVTNTAPISGPVNFVSIAPETYDLRLLATSAAIDAGDPAGVPPAPPVDFDGVTRPFWLGVDVGAFEWHGPQTFLPQVVKDHGGTALLPPQTNQ